MDILALPVIGLSEPAAVDILGRAETALAALRGRGLKTILLWPQAAARAGEALRDRLGSDTDLAVLGDEAASVMRQLACHYDVLFMAGEAGFALPALWTGPDVPTVLPSGVAALRSAVDLERFLARQWLRPPVIGCILIGGRSSRMGRPKHLIVKEGRTWLARSAELLAQVCSLVVVAGGGELGDCRLPRIPDLPGLAGPLAGLLAVLRWQPWATVLACACDLPDLSRSALDWLLDQRRPGTWAVFPEVGGRYQPLLGLYDFRLRPALEDMAREGTWRLADLVGRHGVRSPGPPAALSGAWRNVNRPEELS